MKLSKLVEELERIEAHGHGETEVAVSIVQTTHLSPRFVSESVYLEIGNESIHLNREVVSE
ncbi:MAG TPA: hypothetical protein VHK27_13765 [Gammaproteobacteria bacterium]|nr:hypothetical protein [Gammaproteobacteria bacterium]